VKLKLFSAFELGFAAGMAALTAVLWAGGALHRPAAAEEAVPCVTIPSSATGPSTQPGAALSMPIAGIDPATLKNTFNEIHGGHPHEALDIMAPRGTPVLAVDHGKIVKLFTSKLGGLTIYQFNDAQTLCYYYAHLDHYAASLEEGQTVHRGDVIGYVGSTGNASPQAPHLHFAVMELGPERQWWKGTAIDPLPLLQHGRR